MVCKQTQEFHREARATLLFLFYIFKRGRAGGGGNAKRRRGGEGRGMKTELEEIREMVMDTFFKTHPENTADKCITKLSG